MKDLNDCKFIGRIGKDIELKYLPNGRAVVNFSIACSDDYKDKSGQVVKHTEWINLVAFGGPAEIIGKYLGKGSQIFVSTKQTTRKWNDKNGNDRYTTENKILDFQMLGGRAETTEPAGGSSGSPRGDGGHPSSQAAPNAAGGFDDDIPF